jgi:hypothetical protein
MRHRELIVYASPTGRLGRACADYFEAASELGGTTAQTYPPHCTLTGFFRRAENRSNEVVAEMGDQIRLAGDAPSRVVNVSGLRVFDGWVGLTIDSPWLVDLTSSIIAEHRLGPTDDALRQKDRLHLSLAYNDPPVTDFDPSPYVALAARHFPENGRASSAGRGLSSQFRSAWEVAVWERHANGSWTRN